SRVKQMELYWLVTIVQSLDHFVVPVDDLVASEDFCVRVFHRPGHGPQWIECAPAQDCSCCSTRLFESVAVKWASICREKNIRNRLTAAVCVHYPNEIQASGYINCL